MHQADPVADLDLEAEYNNRARVPEHPGIMQGWAADAAAYRAERPPVALRYGSGEREVMDLFEAGEGPTVLFIHGGYWQALDRSWFSHMARGLNARGIGVAVPSYDLCPNVGVGRIVEQMRAAGQALAAHTARSFVAAGHSAGGHLSACLLATDWAELGTPVRPVNAAYAISGLFDLNPLVPTSINRALGLDAAEATRLSPLHWSPPAGSRLDAVVGGAESGEYLRQSRRMAERWSAQGVTTRYEAIEGANHFTVIAGLADPDSAMVARVAELAAH
ncbi:alpha/beta hydrolase [Caulobacter sp. 17J80-11]|uniref:alpha/beta hydrolase n=1 Tax=Caulobacter sp. 17J80-11 TaxID=2763502 RepID=UPI00165399AF|nr:alpha/beta hydrolase [Caulobacter sp. 17J80-11]MBC6981160.1 alpha/beta hydrolase [Caulobacter sp. 17J80-11]